MQLTKQQLIEAHEQGLNVLTKNGNIKIVSILGDVYGVHHVDTNSKLVKWWLFENFERNDAKIEQPKPKYNGREVKCDSVEQMIWLNSHLKQKTLNEQYLKTNDCICFSNQHSIFIGKIGTQEYFTNEINYEVISFSQYCQENNINEPQWIQGFEVKDGYNDVVMCSDDNIYFTIDALKEVRQDIFPFVCEHFNYKYCRLLKRSEINEIKFID
jgi:hypothetical protein